MQSDTPFLTVNLQLF